MNEQESVEKTSNRKPLFIGAAVITTLVAAGGVSWYMFGRGQAAGEAVPLPKTVSFDDRSTTPGEIAEEKITLEPDQVARIGLKLEKVGETMAAAAAETSAPGVVAANQFKSTPVMALAGGVVRRVTVETGSRVARGQTVAMIFSDEVATAQSRYLQLLTDARTAEQNLDRAQRLVRLNPAGNTELDAARAQVKTTEAELEEHHNHHARTEKLLAIGAASREEYEDARTKIKSAEARVEEAKSRLERARKLLVINPESRTELESAELRRQTAASELSGARQKLRLFGFSESQIDALRSPGQITSEMPVVAPVAGTITSRTANVGEVVDMNKELFRVTDLREVWTIAQVYEQDLPKIRSGSGASVTSPAVPGRIFRGQITYVDPNINPETRTAQVRIELANPDELLKIGMFVGVSFGALGTAEQTVPAISSAAVQNVRGATVVFVATDAPNVFIMKPVRLAAEKDGRFPVLEGIAVGDQVVTDGSFLLRAEILRKS